MNMGSLEYDADNRRLLVWVDGNGWVMENADGLKVEGVDLNDDAQRMEFIKAAAPGGEGLEKYGFKPMRLHEPLTV